MFRKKIAPILICSISAFVILLEIIIGYSFDLLEFGFFLSPFFGAIGLAVILIIQIVYSIKNKKVELIDFINIAICICLIASFVYTTVYTFVYSLTQSDYPVYVRNIYEFPGIFKTISGNADSPSSIPEKLNERLLFISFDFFVFLLGLLSYGSYFLTKYLKNRNKVEVNDNSSSVKQENNT